MKVYTVAQVLNVLAFCVLLSIGSFFLYKAILILLGIQGEVKYINTYFFKGIGILALMVIPLFTCIFFKKKDSVNNLVTLTLINLGIATWILQVFFSNPR